MWSLLEIIAGIIEALLLLFEGASILRFLVFLATIGVAIGAVWAVTRWLGGSSYVTVVAVPIAILAAWPLARLGADDRDA